jgi:broad specificity phosphatase PhoE
MSSASRWSRFLLRIQANNSTIFRSPEEVATRLDSLIADIKKAHSSAQQAEARGTDIVCVAHGHILMALALRWSGVTLQDAPRMFFETGGVVVLGYV